MVGPKAGAADFLWRQEARWIVGNTLIGGSILVAIGAGPSIKAQSGGIYPRTSAMTAAICVFIALKTAISGISVLDTV